MNFINNHDNYKYCIGLMSGTSLDGIDVAICKIKGFSTTTDIKLIDFQTYEYSKELLKDIKESLILEKSNAKLLCSLNFKLGKEYAQAVKKACLKNKINTEDLFFISNHGQTIYHQAENEGKFVKSSLQLGDASTVAYECKTTVISNFRTADICAGGNGAPLVPYVDYLLYSSKDKSRALHNIGGISNTTILPKNALQSEIIAFDTGPGNMMINSAMQKLYNKDYDKDGKIAESGNLIDNLLNELMSINYLSLPIPKSTGREVFGDVLINRILNKYINEIKEDIIHTLTIFTAKSIIKSYKDFVLNKYDLDEIIFTGGGAYNKYLIKYISQNIDIDVKIFEEINGNSDAKEAIAFAVLGNETLHHIPNNMPSATNAKNNVILGQINYFK